MKKILLGLILTFISLQTSAQITSSTSTNSNISISVSSDDDDYTYSAKFDSDKTSAAKLVILKSLGDPTDTTGRNSLWEGKGYSVNVREGRVEMEMDKDVVTKSFQLKIEDLGEQISEAVGSQKSPKRPKTPKTPRK